MVADQVWALGQRPRGHQQVSGERVLPQTWSATTRSVDLRRQRWAIIISDHFSSDRFSSRSHAAHVAASRRSTRTSPRLSAHRAHHSHARHPTPPTLPAPFTPQPQPPALFGGWYRGQTVPPGIHVTIQIPPASPRPLPFCHPPQWQRQPPSLSWQPSPPPQRRLLSPRACHVFSQQSCGCQRASFSLIASRSLLRALNSAPPWHLLGLRVQTSGSMGRRARRATRGTPCFPMASRHPLPL